ARSVERSPNGPRAPSWSSTLTITSPASPTPTQQRRRPAIRRSRPHARRHSPPERVTSGSGVCARVPPGGTSVTPARLVPYGRRMADMRYDAVVLGGGHHGTIIAPYLARAGMKVGVFERAPRIGGGAGTVNGPAAGFLRNSCA